MFLPYETLVELPYRDPPPTFKTELSGITAIASVAGRIASPGHAFYKVMAGTTNEQFRQWAFEHKTFCMPMNVIMTEVRLYSLLRAPIHTSLTGHVRRHERTDLPWLGSIHDHTFRHCR